MEAPAMPNQNFFCKGKADALGQASPGQFRPYPLFPCLRLGGFGGEDSTHKGTQQWGEVILAFFALGETSTAHSSLPFQKLLSPPSQNTSPSQINLLATTTIRQ